MERDIEKQFLSKDAMNLYKAINNLEDEQEIALFLRDVFTLEELKEAIARFKVAKMLFEKCTFRKIEQETRVSSATIARVNNWLKHGCGGYGIVLKNFSVKT